MKVLGIDLSLTSTGLALIEDGEIVWTRAVKTTGKRDDDLIDRHTRLAAIGRGIRNAITGPIDLVVVEAPSFGSVHGSAHDRSGLWWRVVDMMVDFGFPVAQVTPKQRAKYATGNGNSDKKEVHAAVLAQYARDDLPIKTNDEADAVLLAAMGARFLGEAVDTGDLLKSQLDAMEKIKWPSAV